MRIYGHRGARGEMAENTIAGFLHAQAAGVAGIETDIALTVDLVPVLHHDPYLADGRLIRDCARNTMPELPSLKEALLAVPDMEWLLEIKTFADEPALSHPPVVVAREVQAILAACQLTAARVRLLSFDWEVLRLFATLAPQYQRICLTEPGKPQEVWWGRQFAGVTAPAAATKIGAAGWAPRRDSLTPALANEAHALGLDVYTWIVNDPNDLPTLAGVADAIITDVPTVVSGQWPVVIKNTDR